MSAAKHTPGPWIHDTRGYPHPDVKASNGRNVACTWGVNCQPKTKEAYESQKEIARANARLISAAPDLLTAANAALDALTDERADADYKAEAARLLSEALAKATGGAA